MSEVATELEVSPGLPGSVAGERRGRDSNPRGDTPTGLADRVAP